MSRDDTLQFFFFSKKQEGKKTDNPSLVREIWAFLKTPMEPN